MAWLVYSHRGVAKRLVLDIEPAGAATAEPFATQPVGHLVDGSGLPSRTAGVTVTASKVTGSGTLGGTLTAVTDEEGIFAFSDLELDTVTTGVTLQFTAGGLVAVTSESFDVTAGSGTAYALTADATSYAWSGAAATLRWGRRVVAAPVAYTWTPAAATLRWGRRLTAAGTSYAWTPSAATLTYTPASPGEAMQLFSEGFESGSLAGNGWFDDDTVPITTDARPGSAGTSAMVWNWPTSATTPTGVASCRRDFTPSDRVYLSYWIKCSTNWVGSGVSFHPHMFHFLTDADDHYIGPSVTTLTTYDELLYGTGGMTYLMSLQDSLNIDTANLLVDLTGVTEDRAVCGYNGQPESGMVWDTYDNGGGDYRNYKILVSPSNVITDANKNDWHHIESYWQMNTVVGGIGQPDGVMQLWVDGVQVHNRTDIYFRTGLRSSLKFRTFVMAPYIQVGSPVNQSMWIDDIEVWDGVPADTSRTLTAESAAYLWTPSAAALTYYTPYRVMTASPASYTWTPSAATLTYTPVGGDNPNEPSGYAEITNTGLATGTEDGWHIESGTPTFTTDGTAPISPSAVARATYPSGFSSGSPPWGIDYTLPSTSSLYWNMAFKLSSNFQGENSGTNKLMFVWVHDNPSVFLSAEGVDAGTLTAHVRLQNVPDARDHLTPNQGPSGAISRGAWHEWETQIICNTGGNADGIVRAWLDGTLIMEYTDVQFSTSGQAKIWQLISLYPIWGGVGDTVSSTMTIDFDNIYVSKP